MDWDHKRLIEHNQVVRDNIDSISAVKAGIDIDDLSTAKEAWSELSREDQITLWVAPSFGGVFTTEQRRVMKTTEFRTANGEDLMQIPLKNTCNIDTRWGNITLVKENAYKWNSPYDNRGKRYVLPGGGRATREDIEAYGKRTKFEVVFPC